MGYLHEEGQAEKQTGGMGDMLINLVVAAAVVGIVGAEAVRRLRWKVPWRDLGRLTRIGHDAQREAREEWQRDKDANGQEQATPVDPLEAEMRAREAQFYNEVHQQATEAMRQRAQRSFGRHQRPTSPFGDGPVVDGDFYIIKD